MRYSRPAIARAVAACGVAVALVLHGVGCCDDDECPRSANCDSKAPAAAFGYQATGLEVAFSDSSTDSPSQWHWAFGDGASANTQDATHTYTAAGSYDVQLTVTNAYGTDDTTRHITVKTESSGLAPHAEFIIASQTPGIAGLEVAFADRSTNAQWRLWLFGDGATSREANPTHVYAPVDTYTVALIATNAFSSDTASCAGCIRVPGRPIATFTASPTSVLVDAPVSFTDQSSPEPTSWLWAFGDSATATEPSVQHAYRRPGCYTAILTVANVYGSSVASTPECIRVNCSPVVLGVYSETARGEVLTNRSSFIGVFTGAGATIREFVDDTMVKAEGGISKRTSWTVDGPVGQYAGWFVQAGINNSADTRDMSEYSAGDLVFSVITPVDLEIGIRSANIGAGSEQSKLYLSTYDNTYNTSASSGQWHVIRIPIQDLVQREPRTDLTRVKVLFVVASNTPSGGTGGKEATFWIDDVKWEKPCQ